MVPFRIARTAYFAKKLNMNLSNRLLARVAHNRVNQGQRRGGASAEAGGAGAKDFESAEGDSRASVTDARVMICSLTNAVRKGAVLKVEERCLGRCVCDSAYPADRGCCTADQT